MQQQQQQQRRQRQRGRTRRMYWSSSFSLSFLLMILSLGIRPNDAIPSSSLSHPIPTTRTTTTAAATTTTTTTMRRNDIGHDDRPLRHWTSSMSLYHGSKRYHRHITSLRGGGGVGDIGKGRKNWRGKKEEGENTNSTDALNSTTTSSSSSSSLPLVQRIFPVLPSERSQFFSMSIMMFLFVYVFTTVRDTKDSLVVSNCGAESIPFLKLFGVTPSAALFILAYSKISNLLSRDALFYITLIPFFLFYAIFAFLLYPMRQSIHFPPTTTTTTPTSNEGLLSAVFNLFRYWSFSAYFIVSELWASAGIPLLFWQCANDTSTLSQAKRFYPLFAVIANLAPIASGKIMSFVVSMQPTNDDVGFGHTLATLASIKIAICVGIIILYNNVYAISERRAKQEAIDKTMSNLNSASEGDKVEVTIKIRSNQDTNNNNKKPSLAESIRELSKSNELRCMATMVIGYNACVELTEVLWKGLVRRAHPNKSSYMEFMGRFSQMVGAIALFMQITASYIIRTFGWKNSALITPIAMLAFAVPFFAFVTAGHDIVPMSMALFVGTAQNLINKVTKYSLFDPCKEMAYIPLGPEAKVKGKAAVDVLGARLGRSFGSTFQQLLMLVVGGGGTIIPCAPYLGVIYVIVISFWIRAVILLSKVFEPSKTERNLEKALTILRQVMNREHLKGTMEIEYDGKRR